MESCVARIPLTIACKGFFKLRAIRVKVDAQGVPVLREDGSFIELGVRDLTGWFPNLLLDNGKNRMGTSSDWLNYCQVGTDNTAPQATDTGLLGWVAGTSTLEETLTGAASTAPYYIWKRKRFRFGVGEAAANLSEVGVGWGSSNSANLLTRALIVDGNGDPTTVSPLANEILDVWYEFRSYHPASDVTGQVTLDGTLYDYTVRGAEATNTSYASRLGNVMGVWVPSQALWSAYDGEIGTVTQSPSGISASPLSTATNATYSNNSYEKQMDIGVGPSGWNLGNGIRSFFIGTNSGGFQMRIGANAGDSTLPKDTNYNLIMSWVISWTEATIT